MMKASRSELLGALLLLVGFALLVWWKYLRLYLLSHPQ
jgi:hypothetical protein